MPANLMVKSSRHKQGCQFLISKGDKRGLTDQGVNRLARYCRGKTNKVNSAIVIYYCILSFFGGAGAAANIDVASISGWG